MNILLTNFCNGKCPYCFANETMLMAKKREQTNQISLGSFEKTLDFVLSYNSKQPIKLLGGEPSLHNNLEDIFKKITGKKLKKIGFFSNGIISPENLKILLKYSKYIAFKWNINPPGIYSRTIDRLILKNIHLLRGRGSVLGFNIYRVNYSTNFVYPIIEQNHHLKIIRIGIAHPIGHQKNSNQQNYLTISDYPKIGSIIYKFTRTIKSKYPSVKQIFIDCGYTPCLFTRYQRKQLSHWKILSYSPPCGPKLIDIYPDLTVNPCFSATSGQSKKRLTEFSQANQMTEYFASRWIFSHRHLPLASKKCEPCPHRINCFGGCEGERILAAKSRLIHLRKKISGVKDNFMAEHKSNYQMAELLGAINDFKNSRNLIQSSLVAIDKMILSGSSVKSQKKLFRLRNKFELLNNEIRDVLNVKKIIVLSNYSQKIRKYISSYRKSKYKFISYWTSHSLKKYAASLANLMKYKLIINDSELICHEAKHFTDILWASRFQIIDPAVFLLYVRCISIVFGENESHRFFSRYLKTNPRNLSEIIKN